MGDNDPGPAQEAWREFLDVLRARTGRSSTGRGCFDEREVGYGYRNLMHILAFATGMYMNADPEWPMFVAVVEGPARREGAGRASRRPLPVGVGAGRSPLSDHRPAGDEAYLSFTVHRGVRGSGTSSSSTATSITMI